MPRLERGALQNVCNRFCILCGESVSGAVGMRGAGLGKITSDRSWQPHLLDIEVRFVYTRHRPSSILIRPSSNMFWFWWVSKKQQQTAIVFDLNVRQQQHLTHLIFPSRNIFRSSYFFTEELACATTEYNYVLLFPTRITRPGSPNVRYSPAPPRPTPTSPAQQSNAFCKWQYLTKEHISSETCS